MINGETSSKKVLVVDNETGVLRIMKEYLERLGLSAFVAENGEVGLALARCHKPDLILLDLMMPGMSGDEVAAALLEDPDTAGIPVVYLTGLAEGTDVEHPAKGGYRVLSKRLPTAEIMARIEQYLADDQG